MKNIHLIPTDKPSRVGRFIDTNNLFIRTSNDIPRGENVNIYITSDEEIKVGDWFISNLNEILKCTKKEDKFVWYERLTVPGVSKIAQPFSIHINLKPKKIILTTDQSLDGVQKIDDEFLEWFVHNPSCESVEVKRNKKLSNKSIWDAVEGDLVFNNHNCGGIITQLSNDIRVHIISENGEGYMETAITSDNGLDTLVINNYKVYEYSDYKIIIPKEEPTEEAKQRAANYMSLKGALEPKQETIEEAAKRLYPELGYCEEYWEDLPLETQQPAFIEGAKYQQERMYSEDEVIRLLDKFGSNVYGEYTRNETMIDFLYKWFEKNKKK